MWSYGGALKFSIFLLFSISITYTTSGTETQRSVNKKSSINTLALQENVERSIASITIRLNQLLRESSKHGENSLFSPINIYAALALVHLAAVGQTRKEISNLLGLPDSNDQLSACHGYLKKLFAALQKPGKANVTLADGIFAQESFQFKGTYVSHIKDFYNTEATAVDFKTKSTEATRKINKWISDKTYGRIPTLFPQPLPRETLMLIASCLYFSSSWANQFIEYATIQEKFHTGIREVDVHMMNNKQNLGYWDNADSQYEAINLPYNGKEFSMYIVLPYNTSSLDDLTQTLQADDLHSIVRETSFANVEVDYKIPRIKFKWSKTINEQLKELGVRKLFQSPELDNMVKNLELKVSDVTHAAEIEVHEKGTVATAATTLTFIPLSLPYPPPTPPIKFYVNRPFMFFIYHLSTKAIIMCGSVYKPNENIK